MPPDAAPSNAPQTTTTAATADATAAPTLASGNVAADQRHAAAAAALAAADAQQPDDAAPATETPPPATGAPTVSDDAAAAATPPPTAPPSDPQAEGEKRVKNQIRDLHAEAARTRKHFELADKRHAEADRREKELAEREQSYREVATLMGPNGNAIGAAERLAKAQGLKLSEFVEKLNRQLIAEESGRPAANDGVAREVADLRAELKAERDARQRAETEAQQRQHYAAWHKEETAKHAAIAESPEWRDQYPNLSALPKDVREGEIGNAIAFFASRPETADLPRLEVLAALDTHIGSVRARYGQVSPPAASAGKGPDGKPIPAPRANGTDATGNGKRTVPTNGDAANGSGARRRLTMEERRKEAAKVI